MTRLRFFRKRVEQAKCSLSVYESASQPNTGLIQVEQQGPKDLTQIAQWVATLRPPTGMLVCNDIRGQQVINACRSLEIAIPDDLAIIGVDDDDAICPLSDPPLSSVKPNCERVGYRAAEILADMMNGQPGPLQTEYVPPCGVIQRLSTQVNAIEDRELAAACRFIREHACDGIDVNQVADTVSLSRRQLERRFRQTLGRTPLDEITMVQINRVKQLLSETDMTLQQIAELAGYSHKERLSTVFKRVTSQTPGVYRREHSSIGPK